MSRRAHLTRAIASGYGTLVANIVFSLATVPIALKHLSNAEFGLWALATQLAAYLALIDFGMSGSIARILIDHKDDQGTGSYATFVRTGAVVTIAQGALIALAGVLLAPWLVRLAEVPADLKGIGGQLIAWQAVLVGAGFATKMYAYILTAHQRYDVINHANSAGLVVTFGGLWYGFASGAGLFSYIWASMAGMVVGTAVLYGGCRRLQLLPRGGVRGEFSPAAFRELFGFGAELFVQMLGGELLAASQLVIISRFIGLEAAAIYAVCTKTFTLTQQLVWRVFDYAFAGFSEMVARGEMERLRRRFREMMVLSASLSVVLAVSVAACNQSFIAVWTGGRISWPPICDWLLALVTIAHTINRVHGNLAWMAKNVRQMRYVYFIQGLVFVGCAIIGAKLFGMAGILVASLVCDIAISGIYGLSRTARYLQVPAGQIVGRWLAPAWRLLAIFIPIAFTAWLFSKSLTPWMRLGTLGAGLALAGVTLMWSIGLPTALRGEFAAMLPGRGRATAPHDA